jgi:hypothetical protein
VVSNVRVQLSCLSLVDSVLEEKFILDNFFDTKNGHQHDFDLPF